MVLTRDELAAIAALAVEHDLLVVTDEVYEHLVFDGRRSHISIGGPARACASAPSRSRSAGKTFSFTGWKVGWVTATAGARRRRPDRQAVPDVRQRGPVPVRDRRGAAPARLVLRRLPRRPAGASATCWRRPATRRVRGLPAPGHVLHHHRHHAPREKDGFDFCRALPERCGVVAIPNSVFYDDPDVGRSQVRFTFCKRREVLEAAVDRLRNGLLG